MDRLGFSPAALTKVREMLGKPRGLILVAGPAASGKTTTLYAMLNEIGKSDKKVVSLEYPIEFDLPNVTQSQIDPRSGYDYATALSLVARQDPDVVMVGELGDLDTAQAALRTVLSGHLVLSTIHANHAADAIARLLGMGVDPFLLATGLEGMIEQRVLRQVCPACKQSVALSKTERQGLGLKPGQKLAAKGSGCKECKGTGYKGRVGVFAVLPVTEELRDLVLTRPQPGALRRFYGQTEIEALWKDGLEKVKAGLTTFEEVQRMGEALQHPGQAV
jgi:type II secretory ATPase GspE/PulE/Tfp pilus assembly ATPase PilB-like protein